MESRKKHSAQQTHPESSFGLGEKPLHDHERYLGKPVIVTIPPQQSYFGVVKAITKDYLTLQVPSAKETKYGPRYTVNVSSSIARESVLILRELTRDAYKLTLDETFHGPLVPYCGRFVELQEGQNTYFGRIVYVHHSSHRVKFNPVISQRQDLEGELESALVYEPLEVSYNSPMVRVLTGEQVDGILKDRRRQETMRNRETQLRILDLAGRLQELMKGKRANDVAQEKVLQRKSKIKKK